MEVEANSPWCGTPEIDVSANSQSASMSNRSKITMKTTIPNDAAIAKLIRIMPFVLSAVCAGAAFANLIG